jgi:hypothetical protein
MNYERGRDVPPAHIPLTTTLHGPVVETGAVGGAGGGVAVAIKTDTREATPQGDL